MKLTSANKKKRRGTQALYTIGQTVNQNRMANSRAGGEVRRLTHWFSPKEAEAGQWKMAIRWPEGSRGLRNIGAVKLERVTQMDQGSALAPC